ncbi:hypothetical protein NDU88_012124 [Pleurodeles waltl]|uniref:Uncharacterized protein n=1 Tax=Pleurodeles waltl TaxID=8319 RepID=A0AAV7R3C7_PLEWA|nr:hypothetical protein NDU88_012124 [Pleurodeles waltl]
MRPKGPATRHTSGTYSHEWCGETMPVEETSRKKELPTECTTAPGRWTEALEASSATFTSPRECTGCTYGRRHEDYTRELCLRRCMGKVWRKTMRGTMRTTCRFIACTGSEGLSEPSFRPPETLYRSVSGPADIGLLARRHK